ncbi:hypothetical protein U2060_15345, partial [Listeria monocytogenes]|uniref:hypothetical protein n=1 Tax=Listeria monocytogenes TaxID=1639 RepID=UPI002FDBBDCE
SKVNPRAQAVGGKVDKEMEKFKREVSETTKIIQQSDFFFQAEMERRKREKELAAKEQKEVDKYAKKLG